MHKLLLALIVISACALFAAPVGMAQPLPLPEPQPNPAPGVTPPRPQPAPQPGPQTQGSEFFGAIAFTADGSYATSVKYRSKAEAEASVATRCSGFGRGKCEVLSFPGELCVGLSTFISRRWRLSFARLGRTSGEAQEAAMSACNNDRRTRKRCNLRTVACGDGR